MGSYFRSITRYCLSLPMNFVMELKLTLGLVLWLVGACSGASVGATEKRVRENSLPLDDDGQMILSWGYPPGTGDIEIEMKANCTGWIGIGILNPHLQWADLTMAGYDDATGLGYLEDRFVDTANPINGGTLDTSNVQFLRKIDTGDSPQDVPITRGSLLVAWAFNDSDDLNDEHDTSGQRGVHFINFQPPTV